MEAPQISKVWNADSIAERLRDGHELLAGLAGTAVESALAAGVSGDEMAALVKSSMTAISNRLALVDGDIPGPRPVGTRIE